ncbi:MAG: hypothetical protein Q7O66_07955, partial [Dehalococcoidia bacterium]|nr:hypothetical protein [Dehalococcoidia bacterium]
MATAGARRQRKIMRVGIDARHFFYRQAGTYTYVRRLIDFFANAGDDPNFTVSLSVKDKATRLPDSPRFRRH